MIMMMRFRRMPSASRFTGNLLTLIPPLSLALIFAISTARADTFTYYDDNRLQSATQTNGLIHSFTPDEEGNLQGVGHTGTDTTDTNGAGNGIPDWWENYYFGARGIDPLAAPQGDNITYLMKYALGLNPLIRAATTPASITNRLFSDGLTCPYITFVCSINGASLITLEQSTDRAVWNHGSAYFELVSAQDLGNGLEQVVMRCLTPLPAGALLYFRLEASGASVTSDYSIPPAAASVPAVPLWAWSSLAVILPLVARRYLRRVVASR